MAFCWVFFLVPLELEGDEDVEADSEVGGGVDYGVCKKGFANFTLCTVTSMVVILRGEVPFCFPVVWIWERKEMMINMALDSEKG